MVKLYHHFEPLNKHSRPDWKSEGQSARELGSTDTEAGSWTGAEGRGRGRWALSSVEASLVHRSGRERSSDGAGPNSST